MFGALVEYIKQSSDEVDIRGPESKYDSRKINSYPSKVKSHQFSQIDIFRRFPTAIRVLVLVSCRDGLSASPGSRSRNAVEKLS